MHPLIQTKRTIPVFLLALLLACFGLSHTAQAVVPAPDGGYPGGNTAEGQKALQSLTSGGFNAAVGYFSLFANTTGSFNTAVGAGALDLNTASNNTATGAAALLLNTTGMNNTANGVDALALNDTGSNNTATGAFALFSNTTGHENTAIGRDALLQNTTGAENTATGHGALTNNIDADGNTANGLFALHDNMHGAENTAIGQQALAVNQQDENTAIGFQALFSNDSGIANTACGDQALRDNTVGSLNTAIGFGALVLSTGSDNVAIGAGAGQGITTGDNNIDIGAGNSGDPSDVGVIRIGSPNQTAKCFIASIRGITTGNANALPVVIDSAGQLGTMSSSRRFKKDINPIDKTSEAILALKPVAFHYKTDATNMPQFGLIAEEVAEVNPDLVVRDKNGEIYTVRYDAVNAMLLNEFLKEHKKVQEQGATIARLEKQIEALTAGLEKVSAQLEVSKAAPQTVLNSQ
jgi:hypothetical protein